MLLLVLKRILLGFITLFIVSLITFSGVEVLPGDACTTYLEREAYGAALEACYERLGLNTPALKDIFHGQLEFFKVILVIL